MRGDQTFLVYGDRRIAFGEFFRLANSASAALRDDFGVAHGDRVAVLSANNPEWCVSFWATVNLGGILVGLNGWWKTDEIIYGLQDSGRQGPRRRRRPVRAHRRPPRRAARPRGACSSSTPTPPTSAATPGCTASTS